MLKEAELFKWKTHVAELTLKEASAEAEGMKKKVTELEDALKQERYVNDLELLICYLHRAKFQAC